MTRARATPEGWALGAFAAFTATAIAGYWIFALHPEHLPAVPWALDIYRVSFPMFARVQILASAAALGVALFRHAGLRWIPALGAVYLLSFLAEHIGTGTGFPFSGYAYTGLLGPRVLDRVPALIPLSWFLMAAPAWVLARRWFPGRAATAVRLAFATALLVLWDLALDPAMSYLTPYWVWERPGSFYGMPWVNLLGWAGTGTVLMVALELLDRRIGWAGSLPWRWSAAYYMTVLAMPLGMVLAAGLWGAVGATLGALALVVAFGARFGSSERSGAEPEPRTASTVVTEVAG